MTKVNQVWYLGNLSFQVIEGDIFDVDTCAIVNSEQTDFILAPEGSGTVSGGILAKCGNEIQKDLLVQTKGKVMNEGTVLETKGCNDIEKIFHIGFHYPNSWIQDYDDDQEAEYIRIISASIRDVLTKFFNSNLQSISFPLIGCGLFGLSPKLLAQEFMNIVCDLYQLLGSGEQRVISLVIYDPYIRDDVMESLVQSLIDRNAPLKIPELNLCIDFLDRYEEIRLQNTGTHLAPWRICNYAALVTNFIFYRLATVLGKNDPSAIFENSRPATFGAVLDHSILLSGRCLELGIDDPWTQFFSESLSRKSASERAVSRLVHDRNAIAHERKSREWREIYADVTAFLRIDQWYENLQSHGSPWINLGPWTEFHPENKVLGIFERCSQKSIRYVVPHDGSTFNVRSKSK
jgi:O-acetyl-ADP-ribose deacetylase (regulator of RNase III)